MAQQSGLVLICGLSNTLFEVLLGMVFRSKIETETTNVAKSSSKEKYLTKVVLNRAFDKGIHQASHNAMKTAGSVLTVIDGWVVRKHKDGEIEKIEKLEQFSSKDIEKKLNKLVCR